VHYLSVFLLIAVTLSSHAGAVQRWVDEQGRVHYADRAPPDQRSESVPLTAPQPNTPPVPNAAATAQEHIAAGTLVMGDLKQESAQLAALCQQATDNARLFRDGIRLRVRDPDSGEYRFLSDSERERELARAEQQQRRYCSP